MSRVGGLVQALGGINVAERKAFPFYFEWLNYLDKLPPDVAYRAVKALCSVAQGNPLKSVNDPAADMMLSILSATIQRDAEKYEEACAVHKAVGKKGGRPKANGSLENQTEPNAFFNNQKVSDKTKRFSEKPKKPDTEPELEPELEPESERSSTSPIAPAGGDEPLRSKTAQAESLTVSKMARGTAKAADHSTTPVQERFDEFWEAYPKKVGKKAAQAAFVKLKPSASLTEKMLSTLGWQAKSEQWQRNSGQYIPNPTTWLNQGRWDDKPSAVPNAPEGKPSFDLDAYERDSAFDTWSGEPHG